MYAISKSEAWQVVAYNRDGTQMILEFAPTLPKLLIAYAKFVEAKEAHGGRYNYLPTFTHILVWNVEKGFTGLELPYIPTVAEVA